jgi:predicted PurR-regulated permease PerM
MTTPQSTPPFLSLHTAVVLLIAFVFGTVMGILTALTGVPVAGAIAAGLTSAAANIPVLRTLIR